MYQSVLENSHIPFEFEKIEVTYSRVETRTTIKTGDDSLLCVCSEAFQERATRCLKLVSPNCPVIQSLAEKLLSKKQLYLKSKLLETLSLRALFPFGCLVSENVFLEERGEIAVETGNF